MGEAVAGPSPAGDCALFSGVCITFQTHRNPGHHSDRLLVLASDSIINQSGWLGEFPWYPADEIMECFGVKAATYFFRQMTGWLLALALIVAPWAWGTVKPAGLFIAEVILSLACGCWLLAMLTPAFRPKLPRLLVVCVVLLLVQGWFMTINAHRTYNTLTHHFSAAHSLMPLLPGASDQTIAAGAMVHITAVLLALLMMCDFAQFPQWRMGLFKALALAGASIAIYGLGAKAGIWHPMFNVPGAQDSVFGSFVYHGVAGAYLNLAIPVQLGLALLYFGQSRRKAKGLFWGASAMITIIGVMVNISRGAAMICVGELALLAVLVVWNVRRDDRFRAALARWKWVIVTAACFLILGVVYAVWHNLPRWEKFHADFALHGNSRLLAWRVGWGMVTTHPLFGSGPGSFKIRFPLSHHMIQALYSHWIVSFYHPGHRISRWSYVSNDYLQTLIQWGVAGFIVWGVLVLGAFRPVGRLMNRDTSGEHGYSTDDLLISCVRVALLGAFIHAVFDYPLEITALELDVAFYLALNWARQTAHYRRTAV